MTGSNDSNSTIDTVVNGILYFWRKLVHLSEYGWWNYNTRIAIGILFGLFFLVYILFALPVALVTELVGSEFDGFLSWVILAALATTSYAGYRGKSEAERRSRVFQYSNAPTAEKAADVVPLLSDRDGDVRAEAAYVIAQIAEHGGPGKVVKQYNGDVTEIVSALAPLLADDYTVARRAGAHAFLYFSRDYTSEAKPYEDAIIDATGYHDSQTQAYAAIALGNLAYDYPENNEKYLNAIEPLVSDDDHEVRECACVALGHIRSERSIGLLKKLTEDPNPDVKVEAVEALEQLGAHPQSNQSRKPEASGGGENPGQQTESQFVESAPEMDFSDIAGMDSLKNELHAQVIEPFFGGDVYEEFGVEKQSGILFHGPPGTGKTHVSKCLAGELDVNYISVDVGDVDSKLIGEGVENIKQLFSEARQNQPCLIFIDEIDAIATDRSSANQHEDKKKMVNQLLQEMSSIEEEDDILVLAATNNPDDIDEAILRTGRFDSKIEVPKPDEDARLAIFDHHLNAPAKGIDRNEFLRLTSGLVASDIKEIANRAARSAADRARKVHGDDYVTEQDVRNAIDDISVEQEGIGKFVERPPDVDFSDVVGMDGFKQTLSEQVIDPLENPELHEEYGIGVQSGFLLYGPPGTGKTHISRCLAGEMDVSFINAKAGDLVSKWIGEGAQNVQQMFDEARDNEPCLVFVDEIDALATDRSSHQSKSEQQMVNQFLEEISEINDEDYDVVVLGATNRIEKVDDAMLRTGRLNEKIEVSPPDAETRFELLDHYLNVEHETFDKGVIITQTEGFVSSDMEDIAQRAARKALRRSKNSDEFERVTQDDVTEAITELK